jgi:hypothetical protein
LKKDGLIMERLEKYYIDKELRVQFEGRRAKQMRHMGLPIALRLEHPQLDWNKARFTGADPGNSERGGRDSFGKNPYAGMWKIYKIFWEYA